MCVCLCVYMPTCVQVPAEGRRGWTPGADVNHLTWCWDQNLGPLGEQQGLSTTEASAAPVSILLTLRRDSGVRQIPEAERCGDGTLPFSHS